ncbi:hypothetical protein EX30DRAFT_72428 [Ascodesmis nigricans]|uniref:Uncharacterized protein n=1 Tax=Ascodesmis nigricans TaxID=341454 RepID=A0A4S2MTY5_9PEZI|nr:hypothetical protein EX30DRAFT_72428 [Ascodesmis nigricans]
MSPQTPNPCGTYPSSSTKTVILLRFYICGHIFDTAHWARGTECTPCRHPVQECRVQWQLDRCERERQSTAAAEGEVTDDESEEDDDDEQDEDEDEEEEEEEEEEKEEGGRQQLHVPYSPKWGREDSEVTINID